VQPLYTRQNQNDDKGEKESGPHGDCRRGLKQNRRRAAGADSQYNPYYTITNRHAIRQKKPRSRMARGEIRLAPSMNGSATIDGDCSGHRPKRHSFLRLELRRRQRNVRWYASRAIAAAESEKRPARNIAAVMTWPALIHGYRDDERAMPDRKRCPQTSHDTCCDRNRARCRMAVPVLPRRYIPALRLRAVPPSATTLSIISRTPRPSAD